ncbi:unnamed protein product [Clavelina lepadiformis]
MQVHELGHQFSSYLPDIREFESDMDASVNEDCLYLRVYTASPSNAANMPVMVWFYGGGFQFGESGFYPGQVLCGLHDVVLVVPNYRVNVFGFLSLGKATSYSGNVGMLDQLMALRWVQDNIKNFGGNSDNVTIFGESAGATSVALHLLSPLSKGLFHKAIQHSGTVRLPGLVKEDNSVVLKMFLQHLKIAETDPEAIVQKLKSLPAQEVAEAAVKGLAKMQTFGAVVDGKFLPKPPENLLKDGAAATVPSIVGCNNSETSGMLTIYNPPQFFEGFSEEEGSRMCKMWIPLLCRQVDQFDEAVGLVKSSYAKDFSANDKLRWSKIPCQFQRDVFFTVPALEQVRNQSRTGQPSYLYFMTQRMKCHHDADFLMEMKKKPDFCECDHSDDFVYTFGKPLMNGKMSKKCKFSSDEVALSKAWMTYLLNFATTGNPNKGKKVDVEWPQYDFDSQRHLNVRFPLAVSDHLIRDRYKLLNKTLPAL